MATTSILLCTGLAAVISSTYSIKKPLNDAVYGGHGEFILALKYVTLLTIFLFSFFCHSLSIRFVNQVNILINTPPDPLAIVTPEYVSELLEKGFLLNTVGNRLFYAAMPLLLWIFGPVLVFLCSVTMVPVLYNLDVVLGSGKGKLAVDESNRDFESVWYYIYVLVQSHELLVHAHACMNECFHIYNISPNLSPILFIFLFEFFLCIK